MTATACDLHSLVGMCGRHLLHGLLAGALLVAEASTRAAAADVDAAASAPLRKEWVGLEVTPVSFATSDRQYSGDGSFARWQAGPGATVRLGRYRWEHAYVIPFMAGLYVTSGNRTIFLHMDAEGGVIVPGTDRRLELGAGLGFGVLAIRYDNTCDGSCIIGGTGFFASLAARLLLWTAPTFTAGVAVRAYVPLQGSTQEGFGWYKGNSGIVMGALEVGFGRP